MNVAPPVGNLLSPNFGQSLGVSRSFGGFGGGGGSAGAGNRRIYARCDLISDLGTKKRKTSNEKDVSSGECSYVRDFDQAHRIQQRRMQALLQHRLVRPPLRLSLRQRVHRLSWPRAALQAQGGEKFRNVQNMILRGSVQLYAPNSIQSIPGSFSIVTRATNCGWRLMLAPPSSSNRSTTVRIPIAQCRGRSPTTH